MALFGVSIGAPWVMGRRTPKSAAGDPALILCQHAHGCFLLPRVDSWGSRSAFLTKAFAIPAGSPSVIGACRNGDRDGQASSVEKGLVALDTKTTGRVTSEREGAMPGKRVSMRKTREALRLRFELRLGQPQIPRSACLSQCTVHE